jgi:uncharacterized membrane protein YhaH (DUF805 family)
LISSADADVDFWTAFEGDETTPVGDAIYYLLIWPSIVLSIKRFHDIEMSGWWTISWLPGYFPDLQRWFPQLEGIFDFSHFFQQAMAGDPIFIGALAALIIYGLLVFFLTVLQLFKPGTIGDNKYGTDPLSA